MVESTNDAIVILSDCLCRYFRDFVHIWIIIGYSIAGDCKHTLHNDVLIIGHAI